MTSNHVLGIDLGTTYSAMAYINQHGKPEIIPNREDEKILPSVVLFDGDTPIVGVMAKRSAVASPLNVCQFVKRQMGEKDWRFPTQSGAVFTAEEISALILRRLKVDAQEALNCEIMDAVITVPAYFNQAQRKATQDAGKIAGLNVLQIINEPTAAALAYGLDQLQEQMVLIYDLGGGTFDVTIMRLTKNNIDVIATGGDKNLGGFNWDNNLMVYLNEKFQEAGGANLLEDPASEQDLRDKAETAKKTLSRMDKAKVFLTASGKNVSVEVSREDFERISCDLLTRTETLIEMTMEEAKLNWSEIDKVLLVGGSTKMSSVPALIERISGKRPSAELHPDEVVAQGAAILGANLNPEPNSNDPRGNRTFKISDVNSHSLGEILIDSRTNQPVNSIIIPKNTKTKTRLSGVSYTRIENQRGFETEVTEGEGEDINFVHIIGKGYMEIPPYPKGAPFETFFEFDDNGIIHVGVVDKTANKLLGEFDVVRTANRTSDEISQMERRMSSIEVQ